MDNMCTYECKKRIEMDNMCTYECMKRVDPSCPVDGDKALSSPCDLLCTVWLYVQYMEDKHLQCDMCGRLGGGEKPSVYVLYMMGVSMCSCSGCVYVLL